jgi:predicted MFS family arabinose efflux permease
MDSRGRARACTWMAFCAMGVVASTWAARIPAVQDRLQLSPGELALAVLGIEGGALVGLPLGAALTSRWGHRWTVRAGFVVFSTGLLATALAPGLGWLALALGGWAAANSVLDVALNAEGVALGRRYGRPVLSGLHAAQGVGLLLGAGTAAAAAGLGVGTVAHFGAIALATLAVGLLATSPMPAAVDPQRSPAGGLVRRDPRLLAVGAVAFCAFLVDGAATNWIAVHLRAVHDADEGLAAAGYLAFTVALIAGRLPGDRLVFRLSRRRVAEICGLLTAVGTAVALSAPGLALSIGGWALVGLAVAPLAPTVLGAAPGTGHTPAPAAIATVTTIGYLGSFTGPPLIGALAGPTSLGTALALMGVAGVLAAVLARALGRGAG